MVFTGTKEMIRNARKGRARNLSLKMTERKEKIGGWLSVW